MLGKHKTDVLVAGAGPVGLFAAAELTRRGIRVDVFDEEWRGTGFSYALALHPGSVELFEDLGLADRILEAGYRVNRVRLYSGPDHQADLDLSRLHTKYPFLTIIPQNAIELSLEHWLKKHHVKVHWKHRIQDIETDSRPVKVHLERWGEDTTGYSVARKVRVIEKRLTFEADLVLGADGYASTVRKHLGFDYAPAGPSELFAVFEVETDYDMDHSAFVVLDEVVTSIVWPLPDGRCRFSFQLTDSSEFAGDRVKRRLSELGRWISPGLDMERLQMFLQERLPWFTGNIREIIWSVPIRFERGLSTGFGRDAMWLAGDSAHLAGPAGIHSMNVGLREGRDIADRFQAVLQKGAPLSEMSGYETERREEWTRLLGQGLQVTDGASAFARNNAGRLLSAAPATGAELDELLAQVGLEIRNPVTPKP